MAVARELRIDFHRGSIPYSRLIDVLVFLEFGIEAGVRMTPIAIFGGRKLLGQTVGHMPTDCRRSSSTNSLTNPGSTDICALVLRTDGHVEDPDVGADTAGRGR